MSSYLSDEEEELTCPLCMEEIDLADRNFKPCSCGYQICRFCWNHILEECNGLCPACRRPYSKETVEFTPIPQEELQSIKAKKRAKERERREQEQNARKHLSNVRVVQKNLVYVIGIPAKLATEETLRQYDYFGKYGKITKVVINKKTHNTPQGTSTNISIYITYAKKEDATKAIIAVDGTLCEGRTIKASYGTTKYCTNYLKGQQCQNPNCMYLHEPGEEADSYSKEKDETLNQGKHNIQKELTSAKASFPYKETSFKVINASSYNKDDKKEEGSALPVTASWAKLTKSSSSNSSLNKSSKSKESEKPYSSSSGQMKSSSSKGDTHKVPGSSSQQSLISSTSNLSNNSSSASLNKVLENSLSSSSVSLANTTNKHVYNTSVPSDQEDNIKTTKSSNSGINTPSNASNTNINESKSDNNDKKSSNKNQVTSQPKPSTATQTTSNNNSQPTSTSNSQILLNPKPKIFKVVYEDVYTGSSALSDNNNANEDDNIPPNAINNLQHKYEGPFDPFCEDPFHFTEEEIFTALAKLQQKLRLASFENYQQQLLNQNFNNNAKFDMNNKNRLQKLYSNQSIPLQMKAAMLSPEISPENKLSRMMSANTNQTDIATSLNNIIKRKLPNSDEVRNLFNGQNNMYQNNMLSNSAAAQNLPINSGENWNEMNLPNQQYQQNIQSLNSLVVNNSGLNDMNSIQNNLLNNMNRNNSNIQMNNTAGNQYNAAATNYNNMQRLHNLQGINTNMNGNANNMNYVNSMISPELEYQNSVQQQYQKYQNYSFTPRQQQAFMNTNQHPQQQQQQQQLYQRMNSANNANSQQQLPGDFFGQMLHQKQNVQPHGQSNMMNIPFQDPAIMAVRMSGNGQTASPYDNANQMSPLEYLNSFNQSKK